MLGRRRGIPAYEQNAVLKIIIAFGVCFVFYKLTWAIMMVAGANPATFQGLFTDNLAMPAVQDYLYKFWTVITYGWIHNGFWMLFTNMIWLYAFGSLVQMLVGHKQVIPLVAYSIIVGGLFYQLSQFLPGDYFNGRSYMFGAQAGVVGLSVAALKLAPDYRFYLTDTFKIPLVVIAIVFYVLQVMNANVNHEGAPLFMLIGGAAMGYGYIKLLQSGVQPGAWMYGAVERINDSFEPDDTAAGNRKGSRRGKVMANVKKGSSGIQNRVDEILDKINQEGYNSLTEEEKKILMKAGEDNNN